MISALLVMIAAFTGVLTIGAGMAYGDEDDDRFAWASMMLLASTMALSFIAGVLS